MLGIYAVSKVSPLPRPCILVCAPYLECEINPSGKESRSEGQNDHAHLESEIRKGVVVKKQFRNISNHGSHAADSHRYAEEVGSCGDALPEMCKTRDCEYDEEDDCRREVRLIAID